MSTQQVTWADFEAADHQPEPRRMRDGLIPAIRRRVVIQTFDVDESRQCARCGSHVSAAYRRHHGDDDGRVHGCPSCYSQSQCLNGATQFGDDGDRSFIGGGV